MRPLLIRWAANAVLVVTLFTLSADLFLPRLMAVLQPAVVARIVAWILTFGASAPFLWGMLTTYRLGAGAAKYSLRRRGAALMISGFLTVLLLGVVSSEFFPFIVSALLTISGAIAVLLIMRRYIERYYQWFERAFVSGIGQRGKLRGAQTHDHLVPWNGHLAELPVGYGDFFVGKTLLELRLRERFGLNVVVIKRGDREIVAPKASERIFPHDVLLCFATDEELSHLGTELEQRQPALTTGGAPTSYVLRPIKIDAKSAIVGQSIRAAGIREAFDCIIVGIERDGARIQSPKSDLCLNANDLLWVVGDSGRLTQFQAVALAE
jgi:CPA2 family monovalent cation:H+ antiporter-2